MYQYQTQDSSEEDDADSSFSLFMPPPQPARPGRLAIAGAVAGICIWVISGFTIVCLAMALCLGIFIEFIAYLDSMDARAQRREALRRWHAAYYCGAHDLIFVPGESATYRPEAFAQLMHPDAAQSVAAPSVASMNS